VAAPKARDLGGHDAAGAGAPESGPVEPRLDGPSRNLPAPKVNERQSGNRYEVNKQLRFRSWEARGLRFSPAQHLPVEHLPRNSWRLPSHRFFHGACSFHPEFTLDFPAAPANPLFQGRFNHQAALAYQQERPGRVRCGWAVCMNPVADLRVGPGFVRCS